MPEMLFVFCLRRVWRSHPTLLFHSWTRNTPFFPPFFPSNQIFGYNRTAQLTAWERRYAFLISTVVSKCIYQDCLFSATPGRKLISLKQTLVSCFTVGQCICPTHWERKKEVFVERLYYLAQCEAQGTIIYPAIISCHASDFQQKVLIVWSWTFDMAWPNIICGCCSYWKGKQVYWPTGYLPEPVKIRNGCCLRWAFQRIFDTKLLYHHRCWSLENGVQVFTYESPKKLEIVSTLRNYLY